MSPVVDIVERLVHRAHLVLQWCAANAVVTRGPAGGRKFDKAKSSGRIDARRACDGAVVGAPQGREIHRYRGPHRMMIRA
jgi:phage terminase large subunit-like protein